MLATIVFGLSFGITILIPYPISSDPVEYEWDFSSGEVLSLQMIDRRSELIYLQSVVGTTRVTQENGWGFVANPIFGHDKHEIIARIMSEDLKDGTRIYPGDSYWDQSPWSLLIFDCCWNRPLLSSEYRLNSSSLLNPLHVGLEGDLSLLSNFTDVSENRKAMRDEARLLNNTLYWKIFHFYKDGSAIRIEIFGTMLIIQKLYWKYFEYHEFELNNGYTILFNGQQGQQAPTYTYELQGDIFPNYLVATKSLVQNLMEDK
jgi:hypothetical protein